MPVPHARATAVTSTDEHAVGEVPGLLEVLAQVPDPRKRRGRRYLLVFVLAVAVACVPAGAKNFREIGDQAADLPQEGPAEAGRDAPPAATQDHRSEREADPHPGPCPRRGRPR